ncbi:MAG: VaFE repeat-containing surface-anchored protein [Acutalibacteraceae bacterium]|nr:VaFE repeat-containing surface-anchored protein [Acutalibacteraceae bacterium]
MHEKKLAKSIVAVMLSVLMIIMSLPTAMAAETDKGLVQASDGTTVKLSLGNLLEYESNINWTTHIMYADGKMAYCVNPKLSAPSGTFGSGNLTEVTSSNSKYQLLLKALSYGYGGDKFETPVTAFGSKSMKSYMQSKKTQHWLGASGTDLYYLLTHRVLAYIYGDSEWAYALNIDWINTVKEIAEALKNAPTVSTTDKMYILDAKDGSQKVIVFKEAPQLGSLEIIKDSSNYSLTDNNTDCYSLKGTVFTVTNTATNKKYTLTTNTKVNDGSATVKYKGVLNNLPIGEYTIKEKQAGKGYALSTKATNVTIVGNKTSKVNIKNTPQSDPTFIVANKTDKNGKPLVGAEFTVKFYKGYFNEEEIKSGKADSSFKRYWTLRTDSDGYAELSDSYVVDSNNDFYYHDGIVTLPLGTITIQETKAPNGYIKDDTLYIRQITSTGSSESVFTFNAPIVPNEHEKGELRIVKTSEDGVVAGIKFKVYTTDNKLVGTYTTDSKGLITKDIDTGTYKIEEVVSDKYNAQPIQTITVKENQTATVTFKNTLKDGWLKLIKTAEPIKNVDGTTTAGKVDGIEFELYNSENVLVGTYTTGADGTILKGGIRPGTYKVHEIVPAGYRQPADRNVEIKPNQTTTVKFHNVISGGDLTIKKATDFNGYVKNDTEPFIFRVEGLSNGFETEVEIYPNRSVTISLPQGGRYKVTEILSETQKLYWQEPDQPSQEIVVNDNEHKTVTFNNHEKYGNFKVKKTADDGFVKGVNFEFFGTSYAGKGVFFTFSTDENGEYYLDTNKIPVGEYTLREYGTPSPNLYVEQEDITVKIENGKTTQVNVHNENVNRKMQIIKTSDDGIVNDIEFKVSCAELNFSKVYKTDETGFITADNLKEGKYTIEEINVPDRYEPQAPQTIEIKYPTTQEEANTHYVVNFKNTLKDGKAKIIKTSASGNVEGFEFNITGTSYKGEYIELLNLKTDSNGLIVKDLPQGTYTVEEINVPGYFVVPEPQIVTVTANQTTEVSFYNDYQRGDGEVLKTSDDGKVAGLKFRLYGTSDCGLKVDEIAITNDKGIAEFKNILIGTYIIEEIDTPEQYEPLEPMAVTVIEGFPFEVVAHNSFRDVPAEIKKTSEYGIIEGIEFKVSCAELSYDKTFTTDSNGLIATDLYPGTYQVTELNVPAYAVPQATKTLVVEPYSSSSETASVQFDNLLKKGKLRVVKTADDNVIENVEFKIFGTSNSGAEISISAKTDVNGEAIFDNIPIGRYTLSEVGQADRYVTVIDSDFDINWDETTTMLVNNELKKGEIRTKAKDKATDCGYAYVSENTTLIDTVTYQDLGTNTEYTVEGVLMDKETGEQLLVNGSTVTASKTFTTTSTGAGEVDVEFNFNSTELRGKSVVVFEQLYYNGVALASHKDINDVGQTVTFKDPDIGTTAKDVFTDEHEAFVSETTTIVDTVEYNNLIVGKEYTIKGILMNKSTGEPLLVDGAEVTATKTFTAESENGTVDMEFTFNSSALKGTSVVVFEHIYYNDLEVASHADISDDGQTVKFKDIDLKTTATDTATGGHNGYVSETTTIVDRVEYTGLIVGKEYTVTGVLMNKSTGEPLLVDGAEIISSSSFTAESENGYVDITFTFDSSALKGKSVVAFETLTYEDIEVATHTDINDDGQTVTFEEPKLSTTATDKNTKAHYAYINTTTTITDVVEYSNLIVGKEYTVKGILMNKETGEPLLVDGAEVTATKTFTAEAKNGTVEVEFIFNSSALKGTSVVVFETLYFSDLEVATHSDITDDGQTVVFLEPKAGTTAKDLLTGDNYTYVSETTTIVDTVAYENLLVGKEYTVKGILMNKETGEPLLIDDAEVTSEKTFIAEAKNGTVDIIFELNSISLKGKSVVVFEHIYYNNLEVASHADISDDGQTITFKDVDLKTTAKDKTSGKNTAKVSKTTTIVDTVKYSNLIVGKEYTIKGVLMCKETGKALLVNGKQVTATKTFKATTENGSVDVEFTFDSSALEGKSVVVFETLYFNDLEIAVHADINDKGQTVTFEPSDKIESPGTPDEIDSPGTPDKIESPGTPDTTESTPYTGSSVPYVLIILFISSAGIIMISRKKANN